MILIMLTKRSVYTLLFSQTFLPWWVRKNLDESFPRSFTTVLYYHGVKKVRQKARTLRPIIPTILSVYQMKTKTSPTVRAFNQTISEPRAAFCSLQSWWIDLIRSINMSTIYPLSSIMRPTCCESASLCQKINMCHIYFRNH